MGMLICSREGFVYSACSYTVCVHVKRYELRNLSVKRFMPSNTNEKAITSLI